MTRLLLQLALASLLHMSLVLTATAAPHVWVALTEESGAYNEAASVLKADLAARTQLTVGSWQNLFKDRGVPPDLIITVGVVAFENALDWLAERDTTTWRHVAVLATLLPQATYDLLLVRKQAGRRAISAAVLDQPLGRQMALLQRALPDYRRVGILVGPQTLPLLTSLQKEAAARSQWLVAATVANSPDAIYPALKAVLEESDVILALPEPTVYHSGSLQNILLTTYRARVPLVAFSAAYVKAGAVLALYSTPAQVARRAAAMVRIWLTSRNLPPPQLPDEFAVSTNSKVAASLGLQLDDAATLAEDLRQLESGRP